MCRNGINLTQFKLSAHQLAKFAETIELSIEQWENLTTSLGLRNLNGELVKAKQHAAALKEALLQVIQVADDSEDFDEGISITPI